MITVYTFNLDKGKVVAVGCEKKGYPNKDETGAVMLFNSHFDTESEAEKALLMNLSAWVESEKKELLQVSERQKALKANVRRLKGILNRLEKS